MDKKLNLVGVYKDKGLIHKVGISRILGKLRPEMAAPSI
jgi:hypothetical protein